MSKETTKTVLLEAGKKVFLERGYNNAGIEAILQEAGVPKGSFYYYFQSKEDFGLQVLDRFAVARHETLDRFLNDPARGPLERLRRYFEWVAECLQSQECRKGCLVGNLSQEMADQSEAFRNRLRQIFDGWIDRFATCLAEAQAAGEVPTHLDPRALAEFWLDGWQGAVMRAKTVRSIAPLRNFLDLVLGDVLQRS